MEAKTGTDLFIFVNQRKFDEAQGVKDRMKGAEIAALVGVPPENAVVRLQDGNDRREIGIDETVEVEKAQHFFVTRRTVEGGDE